MVFFSFQVDGETDGMDGCRLGMQARRSNLMQGPSSFAEGE
jgi:hypothetical protein